MSTVDDYPHQLNIPTRWKDNDVYGHVNNVEYYSYFDTVINDYLIRHGGLDIHDGSVIGLAIETGCKFHRSLAFPEMVAACLRVDRLGNSSVRYGIGLFGETSAEPAAEGHFVHVFVDVVSRRPIQIRDVLRQALQQLETTT